MVDEKKRRRADPARWAAIGERLKEARLKRFPKMTLKQFAREVLQFNDKTYRTYENGRSKLPDDVAELFATTVGRTAAYYLLGDSPHGSAGLDDIKVLHIMTLASAEELIAIADRKKKPSSNSRMGIGPGIGLSEYAFVYEAPDDAMAGTGRGAASCGDPVIIDPEAKLKPGDVVLAVVGGEKLLRRYKPLKRGSDEEFELLAAAGSFEPAVFGSKKAGDRIIGRAMGVYVAW